MKGRGGMRTHQFGNQHVIVFEPGERVIEGLVAYAGQKRIKGAHFTAIGGFRELELKYFNMRSKQYEQRQVKQQVEVVSLVGNLALKDGKPYIHAHVVVGTEEYHALDGHLGEGVVEPTLELFLTQLDGAMVRLRDERTGLEALHPEPEAVEGIQPL